MSGRISIREIAARLSIGRLTVYGMLESGTIPGIRVGRLWLVTRTSYIQWEDTCGSTSTPGLPQQFEQEV